MNKKDLIVDVIKSFYQLFVLFDVKAQFKVIPDSVIL